MKTKIEKMHGCGNTFIIVDEISGREISGKRDFVKRNAPLYGADGVLFIESPCDSANLKMVYFDRDGTEEGMCGNGIRCVARYAFDRGYIPENARIKTGDGIKEITINNGSIRVNMGPPREFCRLDENIYFVNSSLAHIVYFTNVLDREYALERGRETRYDERLMTQLGHPEGFHVNFVELKGERDINILTYEVGVENITSACGTGAVASAYVSHVARGCKFPTNVKNSGGIIKVDMKAGDLIMAGPAVYVR